MTDSDLCHDGDGNGRHDGLDHLWVTLSGLCVSTWEQMLHAPEPAPFEKPHPRGGYLLVHVPEP